MRGVVLALFFCALVALASANDAAFLAKDVQIDTPSIAEFDVSSLISHLGRTPLMKLFSQKSYFPKIDLFNSPKVNVLVTLESVGSGAVSSSHDLQFFEAGIPVQSSNSDSLTSITNMLTGVSESSHGIIARNWQSKKKTVDAFTPNGQSKAQRLQDTLSEVTQGRAFTISLSGDYQTSLALGVHTELAMRNPSWNNFALYVSPEGVKNAYDESLLYSSSEIDSFMESLGELSFLRIHPDLYRQVGSELFIISKIPELAASHRSSGALPFPDAINIGISSTHDIVERFGTRSVQFSSILSLFDAALTQMSSEVASLYQGQTSTEVLYLGSQVKRNSIKSIPRTIKDFIDPNGEDYYVYTATDVQMYQALIWVSVILGIAFFLAFWFMFDMEIDQESVVFRTVDGPQEIPDVK